MTKKILASKGFTLIEIMIVVAIVIILVTFAVPNFLRSRIIANEAAAISNLKTLNNACQMYHVDHEEYPADLSALASPASEPPYIEPALASGRKQGYLYAYNLVDSDHFTINASSTSSGLLRGKYFYMDESGVIHFNTEQAAGPGDETVK